MQTSPQRIIHFMYHKCLTVYYIRVISELSREFNFFFKEHNRDIDGFIQSYNKPKSYINIHGVVDEGLDLSEFIGAKFSHFIRDPRDMVISGYFYHLDCNEAWCKTIISNPNTWIVTNPYYKKYIAEIMPFPGNISYQNYLNQLPIKEGITLEMIWRQKDFNNMKKWNYNNQDCLELRYENIIGNEEETFHKLFTHYGFNDKVTSYGIELASKFSLKNRKNVKDEHVRSGEFNQWKAIFTSEMYRRFNEIHPQLLSTLGYA